MKADECAHRFVEARELGHAQNIRKNPEELLTFSLSQRFYAGPYACEKYANAKHTVSENAKKGQTHSEKYLNEKTLFSLTFSLIFLFIFFIFGKLI